MSNCASSGGDEVINEVSIAVPPHPRPQVEAKHKFSSTLHGKSGLRRSVDVIGLSQDCYLSLHV